MAETRSVGPSIRKVTGEPGLKEVVDRVGGIGDSGFRRGLRRRTAGRTRVEKPDRAPDIGHRLPAQPLNIGQRVDRIVDIAVLLQRVACPG